MNLKLYISGLDQIWIILFLEQALSEEHVSIICHKIEQLYKNKQISASKYLFFSYNFQS